MMKLLAVTMLLGAAGSPAAAQTHADGPVEIPLREEGGRLFVPVETPAGAELEFVLSTGTAVTVFSESAAASLGDGAELTLGGVPLVTEGSVTLPDEQLTVDGKVLAGMIGGNTLNQFDVLVDLPGGRLVLKPIGTSVSWEGMALSDPVRLRVMHGVVLSLDIELNGHEYPAMLDLGTPTLVVNEGVATEINLDAEDVGFLRVGSTTLHDLPVRVLDLEILRRWSPNGEGFVIVGSPVARDCAISISWVHREMRTCVR